MNITFTSTFWYEIEYSSGEKVIFQFLDTTPDGSARCRLCNGIESTDIFRQDFKNVSEIGETNPCRK